MAESSWIDSNPRNFVRGDIVCNVEGVSAEIDFLRYWQEGISHKIRSRSKTERIERWRR